MVLWWFLSGCAGNVDLVILDLVGTWEMPEDETEVATTQLAFSADGTWLLVDPGPRCDAPPFSSWVCGSEGDWELDVVDLELDEDTTLTIRVQGEPVETRQAHFPEANVFCWDQVLMGTDCIERL